MTGFSASTLPLGQGMNYKIGAAHNPIKGNMVIHLDPELEAALDDVARKRGVSAEALALGALRDRFLAASDATFQPRDEWERRLLAIGVDCGVSLPNAAVSSEGLYD
jgi:predicted transcriptional regulator